MVFMLVEAVLQLSIPMPGSLLWGAIGAFDGRGMPSYSLLDAAFPTSVVGRANSSLNIHHLSTAWLVQAVMGLVIA